MSPPSVPVNPSAPEEGSLYEVVILQTIEELQPHLAAWDELSRTCIEPNVFYESWFLLPALLAFGKGLDLLFVLIYLPINAQRRVPLLCGFFPLHRQRLHRWLPVQMIEMWKHDYCFLTTPLLRQNHAAEALEAFAAWIERDRRAGVLWRIDSMCGDGPFGGLLAQLLHFRGWATYLVDAYSRAMLRIEHADARAYLAEIMPGRRLRELRRKERHLAEQGSFEIRVWNDGGDVNPMIEDFLQIEAGGWKGREGTAMASSPVDADFFREVLRGAAAQGKLQMLALVLNGHPVAMKCNFLSGEGGFAFKIAYDESNASFSPGLLLEIETIQYLHEKRPVRWMDSCAAPDHFMINRLWIGRRLIRTKYIATGRSPGGLLVALMPLARWCKRVVRRILRRS